MIEQLIKEVIKVLPKAEIWLGGPEASYRAKEFMQKYSFLRGIMIGEGEETFYQLLQYYKTGERSLKEIQSILYQEEGEIQETIKSGFRL